MLVAYSEFWRLVFAIISAVLNHLGSFFVMINIDSTDETTDYIARYARLELFECIESACYRPIMAPRT